MFCSAAHQSQPLELTVLPVFWPQVHCDPVPLIGYTKAYVGKGNPEHLIFANRQVHFQ